MKKIFTLILIFGLTIQTLASEDKIGKGVGDIATTLKYESEKTTVLTPFLLNFFLSLGIGSFVQGDYIGGSAVLGTQVLGGIFILTGWVTSGTATGPTQVITGATIVGIGSIAITVSYITGLIIPFTFANRYNADLRKRLGI